MKNRAFDHRHYTEWRDPAEVDRQFREEGEGLRWAVYIHVFPNEKKYIGITSQIPSHRWGKNGSGYAQQEMVWRAISKYGWENIEHWIITVVDTLEEAGNVEEKLIKEYQTNTRKYGYNVEGGGRCSKGYHLSESTKKKMSESRMGEKNWIFGKHIPEETRKKLSEAHKGKVDVEAVRAGAKKRMGSNAYNARSVIMMDIDGNEIKRYSAIADASRETGTRTQDIYNCCNGRQKTTHGYRWKYAS